MKSDIAVKIDNVSKVYKLYDKPFDRVKESLNIFHRQYHKKFYALKNINLEIKKGEVLGIVGVNGAGKSTLLKIISRVLTPTNGHIKIQGEVNAILELGSSLKPEMTGRENIKLNLQIKNIMYEREKITQDIIDFADIGVYIDQPVKTYSSGMKARLGFGIATSTDPDVLIVDEVLAVGDVLFRQKCYGKIKKLFKDGKTVIFVSHSAQSVIEFCTRAVLLYDREIILDDTPKKVTDFYQKLVFSKDQDKVINEMNLNEIDRKKVTINEVDKKYYLPNLKSTPNVIRNYDVDVLNIIIENEYGKKVNVLNIGHKYSIKYKVKFNVDCRQVKFGHLIKTHKGLILSGETLPGRSNPIPWVKKGQIYTISSSFISEFVPGTYFIDVGATSDIKNEKVYLNMQYDFMIFKVQGQNFNFWGTMNIWTEQKVSNEIR